MIESHKDAPGNDVLHMPLPVEQDRALRNMDERLGESRQSGDDTPSSGEKTPASEQRGRMPSRHDERAYRTYRNW